MFWRRFFQEYWGRKPAVFKNAVERPALSPAQLFALLKRSADRARSPMKKEPLRFFGDGVNAQVLEDFEPYLPTEKDATYQSYAKRVEQQLGHREWGLALNDIHRDSPEVWHATREFGDAIFSHIGLSAGEISAESFIGPYRSTAAGIHKDKFHVFTFPLIGKKTMLAWPYASVADTLGLPEREDTVMQNMVSPFRRGVPGHEPTVLEADVGDLIYWPPGAWHVGQGRGHFNATLILTVRVISDPNEWLKTTLGDSDERFAPQGPSKKVTSQPHLNQLVKAAGRRARRLQSPLFAEQLRNEFDRRCSAVGVDPPVNPITPKPQVQPGDVLEADARFPIVMRRKGDTLTCFINGYKLDLTPAAKTMALLVRRLNRGGRISVDELCRLGARSLRAEGYDGDTTHVLGFLSTCVSFRALTLVPKA